MRSCCSLLEAPHRCFWWCEVIGLPSAPSPVRRGRLLQSCRRAMGRLMIALAGSMRAASGGLWRLCRLCRKSAIFKNTSRQGSARRRMRKLTRGLPSGEKLASAVPEHQLSLGISPVALRDVASMRNWARKWNQPKRAHKRLAYSLSAFINHAPPLRDWARKWKVSNYAGSIGHPVIFRYSSYSSAKKIVDASLGHARRCLP